MCTIMLYRETLPAEKRSREDSQKAVDRLMAYDRQLASEPSSGKDFLKAPLFEGHPRGICSMQWGGGGKVYVWLDNCGFGNSRKKGFYYVRYQLSMLAWGSTAYAHPALIVQKNKLRPDQVEYMERKCRETIEDAKRKTQDTRHKTQDTRHKTQDSRLKTQDSRLKMKDER